MLVCIDTSLLILTVQARNTAGNDPLMKAAAAYERWLSAGNHSALIPTPVVAEFLTSRDKSRRKNTLQHLQSYAEIGSSDLRAATLAGEIRYLFAAEHGLPKGQNNQILTVDIMIAAIAIVNNATHLITHNIRDFRRILECRSNEDIELCGVEEGPPGQSSLFG